MILSFFRTAHALWGTTSPWRTEETFANARRSARAATRGMDDARETRRRVSVDDKPMFGDLIVNDAWCRESIGDLN
jgi:hypothetical protein